MSTVRTFAVSLAVSLRTTVLLMSGSSGLGALRLATHVQAWKNSSLNSPHVKLLRTDFQGLALVIAVKLESTIWFSLMSRLPHGSPRSAFRVHNG
jgi:hypothetical protein